MSSLYISKLILRLACYCLWCGLLALIGGCGKNPKSVEHAEVTGKVLYEGKPLPGGQVTFVTVNGGFVSSGHIDQNGNYRISAPVGEVIIGVDNSMLQPGGGGGKGKGGGNAPKGGAVHPNRPDSESENPIKGRWVNIPLTYADPQQSGLKYTVKPGPQTYDIKLTSTPIPPSGAPSGQ
jgi:hypothetical protein